MQEFQRPQPGDKVYCATLSGYRPFTVVRNQRFYQSVVICKYGGESLQDDAKMIRKGSRLYEELEELQGKEAR